MLPLMHPPTSAFTDPAVGWLMCCFLPSAFVIAHHHATINTLVAGRFCCHSLSTTTTAAVAIAAAAGLSPIISYT
jgi:hypothetical protein